MYIWFSSSATPHIGIPQYSFCDEDDDDDDDDEEEEDVDGDDDDDEV